MHQGRIYFDAYFLGVVLISFYLAYRKDTHKKELRLLCVLRVAIAATVAANASLIGHTPCADTQTVAHSKYKYTKDFSITLLAQ